MHQSAFRRLPTLLARRVSACYAIRRLAWSRWTAEPRVVAVRTDGWLVARQQVRCVAHAVPPATALHGFANALLCWYVAPNVTHAHYFVRARHYCCVMPTRCARPMRCVTRRRCAAHGSGSWCAGQCAMLPHYFVNALRCWTAPTDSSVCHSLLNWNVQRYSGARSCSSWIHSLHFLLHYLLNFLRYCVKCFQWSRELRCGRFRCATQHSASH